MRMNKSTAVGKKGAKEELLLLSDQSDIDKKHKSIFSSPSSLIVSEF